jgi:hypothetical protein
MRARLIKPGFFKSDELAALPPLGRILFAGLWCIADRCGRLKDRPSMIKAEVLPYDDCDCNALLDGLARGGFIVRYGSGRARFIQVVNFTKHQTPHMREPESTVPAPVEHDASTVLEPVEHQSGPAVPMIPVPTIPDPVPPPAPPTPAPVETDARAPDPEPLPAFPKPRQIERATIEAHPLYEPLVALFGRPPAITLPKWQPHIAALDEMCARPEDVPRAAVQYARIMGLDDTGRPIRLSLKALVEHWHACIQPVELAPARRSPSDHRMPTHGELNGADFGPGGKYGHIFSRPYDDDEVIDDMTEPTGATL